MHISVGSKRNVIIATVFVALLVSAGVLVYLLVLRQDEGKKPLVDTFELEDVLNRTYSSEVEMGAVMGAHWFGRVQRTDGSFIYIYDPDNGTEIDQVYSLARHSASMYGLVWAYQYTKDRQYLEAAIRSSNYTERYVVSDDGVKYMNVDGHSSLFDNALALIGFSWMYNATGDSRYLELMKGLADMCVKSQNDKGQIDLYYGSRAFSENPMASGEALLGLILAYRNTGIAKYLESFKLGAKYYADYYTVDGCRNMRTDVYSWFVSAFSLGYMTTKDPYYKNASYAMSDWIINTQFGLFFKTGNGTLDAAKMARYPQMLGSFRDFPSMNSCTYSEGLGDVYGMARQAGDAYYEARYKEVLLNASRFILNLQYGEAESKGFASSNLTIGGYRHDLFDTGDSGMGWQSRWIRIDYTQHAIGALFRILEEIPASDINAYYASHPRTPAPFWNE